MSSSDTHPDLNDLGDYLAGLAQVLLARDRERYAHAERMVALQAEAELAAAQAREMAQQQAEQAAALAELRLLRARHNLALQRLPAVAQEFDQLLQSTTHLRADRLLAELQTELPSLAALLDKLDLLAHGGLSELELAALRPVGLFQLTAALRAVEPLVRRLPARGLGRFVKWDAAGERLPAHAEPWAAVLDNSTRLLWEVKTESGLHSRHARYSNHGQDLAGDSGRLVKESNAERWAGRSDWRLPSSDELVSLANTRAVGGLDFRAVGDDFTWSSTAAADGYAWFVSLTDGSRYNFDLRSLQCAVHLVCGPLP